MSYSRNVIMNTSTIKFIGIIFKIESKLKSIKGYPDNCLKKKEEEIFPINFVDSYIKSFILGFLSI